MLELAVGRRGEFMVGWNGGRFTTAANKLKLTKMQGHELKLFGTELRWAASIIIIIIIPTLDINVQAAAAVGVENATKRLTGPRPPPAATRFGLWTKLRLRTKFRQWSRHSDTAAVMTTGSSEACSHADLWGNIQFCSCLVTKWQQTRISAKVQKCRRAEVRCLHFCVLCPVPEKSVPQVVYNVQIYLLLCT